MNVRCSQCGYDNDTQYRYCGMCGAALTAQPSPGGPGTGSGSEKQPAVEPAAPVRPKRTEEPSRDLSYLLEEAHPHPHHGRMYVALVVLLLAVVVLALRWRQDVRGWIQAMAKPATSNPTPAASNPTPSASNPPPTPSVPQPTPNISQAPSPSQSPAPAPDTNQVATQPPPQAQPGKPLNPDTAPEQKQAEESSPAEPPARSAEQPAAAPAAVEKPSAKVVASPGSGQPMDASAAGDDLAAAGEKYLYGNGVAQDCNRAESSLRAAAQRGSAKAQAVLGTMYATGHCATRDLPTAYRWFARALHKDPNNARIEQDLQVLWKQMTPDERQVALRSDQ